jgi:mRNA-degrading endonuclease RelE of RelBE toxin-antitoxin system
MGVGTTARNLRIDPSRRRDVYWTNDAVAQFFEISDGERRTGKRILDALRLFAAEGRGDLRKLEGREDEWRLRVGDWRIVFSLQGRIATVTGVGNRRDVY